MSRVPWFAREPEPEPSAFQRYVCSHCMRELDLAWVYRVERAYGGHMGAAEPQVRIIHSCPCVSVKRATRYPFSNGALLRLFGDSYTLPWPSPDVEDVGEVREADPPPVPSADERRESMIARWRWELDQCASVREFLLFCRGPRGEELAP